MVPPRGPADGASVLTRRSPGRTSLPQSTAMSEVRRGGRESWVSRLSLPVAATLAAAAIAYLIPRADKTSFSYAAASPDATLLDLSAGLCLIAAGVLCWAVSRDRLVGLLAVLAGLAWFGPDLAGWQAGPAALRSLGVAASVFLVPLLFGLVLAAGGMRRTRSTSIVAGGLMGGALVVAVGTLLTNDPFRDLDCWPVCALTGSPFLLVPWPQLARALDVLGLAAALVGSAWLCAGTSVTLRRASHATLTRTGPISAAGLMVGTSAALSAVLLLVRPHETPADPDFASLFAARALSMLALAAALTWHVVSAVTRTSTMRRLAAEIGSAPSPGTLASVLAQTLHDTSLEVAYRLPGPGGYIEADGRSIDPPSLRAGRGLTPITRGGQVVAIVSHDASLDPSLLEREIGAAVRLSVDNERLQATLSAQLLELQASRRRVVEVGDAERQRLERDLHDGCQQRLVALSIELHLARTAAERAGDVRLVGSLEPAEALAARSLDELRTLAHGIFPAVLSESGLAPALATFADRARVPIELDLDVPSRCPSAIETAAYVTVTDALAVSVTGGATRGRVSAARREGRLVVEIDDDRAGSDAVPARVADRVSAVGGHVESRRGAATTGGASSLRPWLRAELPCG